MSAKIRMSYEREPELAAVVVRLGRLVDRVKRQPPKGRYRLAYIELKSLQCPDKIDIIG